MHCTTFLRLLLLFIAFIAPISVAAVVQHPLMKSYAAKHQRFIALEESYHERFAEYSFKIVPHKRAVNQHIRILSQILHSDIEFDKINNPGYLAKLVEIAKNVQAADEASLGHDKILALTKAIQSMTDHIIAWNTEEKRMYEFIESIILGVDRLREELEVELTDMERDQKQVEAFLGFLAGSAAEVTRRRCA